MKPSHSKKPSRIPVLLSTVVCPGAGQFVQRRWLAGIFFTAGFLWGFCWLMLVAGKVIISFYRMGFEFETYEPEAIKLSEFIAPIATALLFYLANLFDVVIAQHRLTKTQRENDFTNDALPQEKPPTPPQAG